MINAFLLGGSSATLLTVVILGAIVASKRRYARRRKALEQILERYSWSRLALVRYVMLNRNCSEESAYQRLALFVKKRVPVDDQSDIDRLLVQNRQSLLDRARNILLHDPDEIDKI